MSIESLRFKPGIRTSLNSSTNIKPNFASQKAGEGTQAVQKQSAASRTAAANLSNSTLTTVDWQGQNSSVFGNSSAQTSSLFTNSAVRTSGSSASGSSSSTFSSSIQRDNKYVSSGYWNKLENDSAMGKSVYMGYENYGYSRGFGSTGGTRRSGMRSDSRIQVYDQYVYDQLHPKTKKSFWQKVGDVVGGIAGVVGLAVGVTSLFKGSKSSSSSSAASSASASASGSPSAAVGAAANSPSSSSAIEGMRSAGTSAELSAKISTANDEVENIGDLINEAKSTKAEAKKATSGLKSTAKQEAKQAKAATKEYEAHKSKAAEYKQQAATAKGAIYGATTKKASNNTTIKNNRTYIDANKTQIANWQQQLNSLLEPAPDATPQDKAQYQKQKAEIQKQIDKLEKQNDKYQKEIDKCNEDNTKQEEIISKNRTIQQEAETNEAKEIQLANDAKTKADKENKEAKDAQDKLADNQAEIDASTKMVDDLKQERSEVKEAIGEQKDRLRTMKRDEKVAQKRGGETDVQSRPVQDNAQSGKLTPEQMEANIKQYMENNSCNEQEAARALGYPPPGK